MDTCVQELLNTLCYGLKIKLATHLFHTIYIYKQVENSGALCNYGDFHYHNFHPSLVYMPNVQKYLYIGTYHVA